MNNQAPIEPNTSAYRYFSHMYANYLRSTVRQQHYTGVEDYNNYVLPVIVNGMNPFDDSLIMYKGWRENRRNIYKSKIKKIIEKRMESLFDMINEIIEELKKIPNHNITKILYFNELIHKWNIAIGAGDRLLSQDNHIIIKCVFVIWSRLILYVNSRNLVAVRQFLNIDTLLEKFNTLVKMDYSNSNNNNNSSNNNNN
jgi:hypothetical protein